MNHSAIPPGVLLLAAAAAAQPQWVELGRSDHLPPERRAVVDVAAGDLDGDGAPELALLESQRVAVLRNNRHAVFAAAHELGTQSTGSAGAVSMLDLDSDGDRDVLWAVLGGAAGMLRNDGAGGLAAEPSPVSGDVRELATGDVDGDGDEDVFAAMSLPPGVGGGPAPQSRLFRNDGGALVDVTATHLPVEAKNTAAPVLFDADGDGDLDLFCGMAAHYLGPSAQNELWLNDGSGHFARAVAALPPDVVDDVDVAAGDVDGDGDLDLVTTPDFSGRPALLLRNDGSGGFAYDPAALPQSGASARAVALADFDADGDLDLACGVASPTLAWLELLRNDGAGSFAPWQTLAVGDTIQRLVALDADADSLADLFLGNRDGSRAQRARLLLGDGAAGFLDAAEPLTIAPPSTAALVPEPIALADVDGDGDLDMLRAGDVSAPLRLLLNDGDRPERDVTATHVPPLSGRLRSFGALDLDGDGADDAWLQLQDASGSIRPMLLVGGAGGVLASLPAATSPTSSGAFYEIVAHDFDRDGLQDLIMRDTFGLHPWRGVAPYSWQPDPRSPSMTTLGVLAIGDVDGDLDADLVAKTKGHLPSDQLEWHENAGDGSFAPAGLLQLAGASNYGSVHLGDADLDGDLDVFALGTNAGLFLNDGAAGFALAPRSRFPLENTLSRRSRVVDVDADGDLDVFGMAGLPGRPVEAELFLNDGRGAFADHRAALGALRPLVVYGYAVGDVDLDGDADLVVDSPSTGTRVITNTDRHARIPWLARRGRPLRIELLGAPSEAVVPLFALQAASWPWPPFGVLRLHPATLAVLPITPLSPSGSLAMTFTMPNVSAVVGTRLHAQALHLGPPVHFGNHAESSATR